jgi:predicted acylesterase/phospholipase RssA
MTYKNLIIPGGGIYGILLVGILENLEKYGLLKDIKSYLGTSAGSIICFLLVIGYSISDIHIFLNKFNFSLITNLNKNNIFDKLKNNYGISNTNNLKIIFKNFLIEKKINPDITFSELYELFPIDLTINIACINNTKLLFCNYKNTPNFKVIDIITISCSIPIIFEPSIIDDKYYVDGGLYDSCPVSYYKEELNKTLIIKHCLNIDNINSIYDYLYYLLICKMNYSENYNALHIIKWYNISDITLIDFNIDNNNKNILFNEGKKIAIDYIKNNNYYQYYNINNIK